MKNYLKPLKFALVMAPVGLIGGALIGMYQFSLFDEETIGLVLAQLGSVEIAIAIAAGQSALYAAIFAFFGYVLAEKVGLLKSFRFEKKTFLAVIPWIVALGVLFGLDYWTFGKLIPEVAESYLVGITAVGFLGSVLYGGIIEELMLRLFFMSLVSWILWKLFYKRYEKEEIPKKVFVIANVVAAILFAAGHIPATIVAFGGLTPLILLRCFLLNGGFGLYFGYAYSKYGIQYAMLAHGGLHVVSKVIWILFI